MPSSSLFSDLKPRLKNLLIGESRSSNNRNFRTIGIYESFSSRSIKHTYLILETRFDSSDIFPFILVDLRILFFGLDFELDSFDWFDWSFSNVEELRFEFILELGFEDCTRIEDHISGTKFLKCRWKVWYSTLNWTLLVLSLNW